jgi:hypothetical protein
MLSSSLQCPSVLVLQWSSLELHTVARSISLHFTYQVTSLQPLNCSCIHGQPPPAPAHGWLASRCCYKCEQQLQRLTCFAPLTSSRQHSVPRSSCTVCNCSCLTAVIQTLQSCCPSKCGTACPEPTQCSAKGVHMTDKQQSASMSAVLQVAGHPFLQAFLQAFLQTFLQAPAHPSAAELPARKGQATRAILRSCTLQPPGTPGIPAKDHHSRHARRSHLSLSRWHTPDSAGCTACSSRNYVACSAKRQCTAIHALDRAGCTACSSRNEAPSAFGSKIATLGKRVHTHQQDRH